MSAGRSPSTSLTAMARASAAHNEQQVLVARALESERRVTAVRIAALLLSGISQAGIGRLTGDTPDPSLVRIVGIAVYGLFAIGSFIMVRRVTPRAMTARVMPLVATTFDVGFILTMIWADHHEGCVDEMSVTAVSLALVVTYAILRYGTESLVYSTVLAIVTFTIAFWTSGSFSWSSWTHAIFFYCALAGLLHSTRLAVRTAFVDLKRREALSKLVPAKVVDEILAGREDALRPARRDVTVLFSDVRGFTSYSEGRDPEDVLAFLDDYFGRMTQVVQGHDGSVNKFIGDGMLALWGAPQKLEGHAVAAVKAALDMQKVMTEINAHRAESGEPPLAIGIGVHTGSVAAGMVGGGSQSEYSVIGDAVNLASRIEGLTKDHGTGILVSEATWARLGDRFVGERVGEVAVKGRKGMVVVYAVTGSIPRG